MKCNVTLNRKTNSGSLVALADVELQSETHSLILFGFRVINASDSKGAWVAAPQFEWSKGGKRHFKEALKMDSDLKNKVCKAVMEEYLKQ